MLLIYCITSININVLVKFNPDIHVIKQNYDIGNPGVLHVLEFDAGLSFHVLCMQYTEVIVLFDYIYVQHFTIVLIYKM
jgi:hypothetical protein